MRIDCGPCIVRPYRPDDTPAIAREANNRKVAANMRDLFPHPYTEADAEGWVAHATSEEPMRNFAIEVGGAYAGGIGLKLEGDIDRVSAELGYWLGERFWGRGIATAAIRGFVPWAFGAFQLERIYATPFMANAASARVLEKASFNREGVMRRAAIKDGVVIDLPLYARLRGGRRAGRPGAAMTCSPRPAGTHRVSA
jgi:ribosomal-protein-alanine N-acetyltransferase